MSADWLIGITANHGGRTRAAQAARIREFAQLQLATTYLSFVSRGQLKLLLDMRHAYVLGGTYAGVADRLSRIQKHVYGRCYRALVSREGMPILCNYKPILTWED